MNAIYWPLAALIFAIFFCLYFNKMIIGLLSRINSVRSPYFGLDGTPSHEAKMRQDQESNTDSQRAISSAVAFDLAPDDFVEKEAYFRKFLAEKHPNPDQQLSACVRLCILWSQAVDFLHVERVIYRSQYEALVELNRNGTHTRKDFEEYHRRVMETLSDRIGPEFDFEKWLSFLQNRNLVTVENDNISLSAHGKAYLIYRTENGLDENVMIF